MTFKEYIVIVYDKCIDGTYDSSVGFFDFNTLEEAQKFMYNTSADGSVIKSKLTTSVEIYNSI